MKLPADIPGRVRYWSQRSPEHPAQISAGKVLTYGDLETHSNLLAAYLSHTFPGDHAPIAVIGHKEPELLVGFLAAIKSGHPYIPIDDSLPQQRITTILEKSKAALSLTAQRIAEIIHAVPNSAELSTPQPIDPESPWYIIFTSGSTGEPKGVVITTACLESFVAWMLNEQHPTDQQEIFLNQAPFSFDLSVMDLYLSLATGSTLYSITRDEQSNPQELFLSLARSHATAWVSTPSFAQLCLSEPTFSANMLPHLHKFLFCGETLPPEVVQLLQRRFPDAEIWNTYGPTETTCATTSVLITPGILSQYNPLPVGYPKPDGQIFLMEPQDKRAESNERGEIIIAGPNVSPGYLGRPDLTEKAFFIWNGQRAYHTGDWGHFEDGMLFCDGRMDNQIKLHGYRIELGDIEANLMALPSILDAVVLPHATDGLPDYLAAFVVLREKPAQSDFEITRALKRELGKRLPAYMLPRRFIFIDKFPMTANGKIDRRKLIEALP